MPGNRAPEAQRRAQIVDAALVVAARDRLDRLTVRRVAAEAGLSPGLVFHHLTDKETLLLAVLDRLIERTIPTLLGVDEVEADGGGDGAPPTGAATSGGDRLLGRVRADLGRIERDRELIELFFDFWVMGTRHPEVRARIAAALRGYRSALLPLAAEAIEEDPTRFAATTPERLAALVVAFILGHAVQAVLDPDASDVDGVVVTLDALVPPAGGVPS